ncbi:AMP-binding protein [Nocardia terpenica]|nr:AMP-binding protein [Nocardia terpenica]MBF6103224.1 AMP-binding protein [Nocardia terpenica]MBF6110587.1 AMP-binding protein [Nocardia terpenica]MBF6116718.1 AMP-binding protein [Nocardia terpenica]
MMNQHEVLSVAYGATYTEDAWDVLDRFEHWVTTAPEAIAVEDGTDTYDYAELSRLADDIEQALADRVRPGELVAVCLDRSVALVAVAVAVARMGAVYLPLGPRPGERRLAAVADRLPVACLIGTAELLPAGYAETEPLALPVPGGRGTKRVVAAFAGTPVRTRPAVPEGTFYTVLTSGSTGMPKAVAVGRSSFGILQRWYAERTGSGPGDRHSLLIGVSFDPHVKELWAALSTGATLTVAPEAVRWDPVALTDWWRTAGVTLAILPTPLAELVLDRPWPHLPALRRLEIGGDRLRRWPAPDVTAVVDNAYGPAEATVLTTVHTLTSTEGQTPPPIGLPMAGAVVCVTDDEGRLVARGESGELRIGGSCLAIGYLDAERTAERFVPAPAGVDCDRVYRTGDRVLMRADGVLEFVARMDDQVKVSGVRIEPAEVESAFEHHPRVRRAAVAAQRHSGDTVRLVAFVQPVPDETRPDTAELLREARDWLPEQAVPAIVRYVDAFPLDANGKVDKAALLATLEAAEPAPAVAAAATVTEEMVLGLCRKLLDNNAIAPLDNFVAAGGTSLLAAQLLAALEDTFEVRLRAPELLRQPDLRSLAALVDTRRAARPLPTGA